MLFFEARCPVARDHGIHFFLTPCASSDHERPGLHHWKGLIDDLESGVHDNS